MSNAYSKQQKVNLYSGGMCCFARIRLVRGKSIFRNSREDLAQTLLTLAMVVIPAKRDGVKACAVGNSNTRNSIDIFSFRRRAHLPVLFPVDSRYQRR